MEHFGAGTRVCFPGFHGPAPWPPLKPLHREVTPLPRFHVGDVSAHEADTGAPEQSLRPAQGNGVRQCGSPARSAPAGATATGHDLHPEETVPKQEEKLSEPSSP